ncbi:unnamed protein product [Rotaria sordida]|uniref:Uncharacterized protein n=2 Tax=Rotaria sordida TaxID=392033 RepID=A0A813YBC8_9BILA|nr:unnamed protein product [Rotaria sordida]
MKILLSNINTFVHEHQKKSRDEFEYKRQVLILDGTDHRLIHTFFNFKPNKSQITSARRIWRTTTQQISLEEQVEIMEHRLASVSLSTTISLFDRMLDDIDNKLIKSLTILGGAK